MFVLENAKIKKISICENGTNLRFFGDFRVRGLKVVFLSKWHILARIHIF